MKQVLAVPVLPLLLADASCEPEKPTPERIVFADSLGAQIDSTGITNDGRTWYIRSGSSLSYWEDVAKEVAAEVPTSITFALGSNEGLSGGGWTQEVQDVWEGVLETVDGQTCVTFVLPHFEPQIEDWWPGALAQVEEVRAGMLALADDPKVDDVRDWRPPVQQNPDWIGDGVHLYAMGGQQYIDDPAFVGRYETVTNGICP